MLAIGALALAEGGGNIISPDGSLVVVLILFLIFAFVLNRILFKPITAVLDERNTLTQGAVTEARALTRSYQARLAEYEATIRQARAESYRSLEQRRAAALEQRRQLIDGAKQESVAEIERARAEIAEQAAKARAELEAESRRLAAIISRTVLGRAAGGAE